MRRRLRAGLLPLYLKLYDERLPERRAAFEPFLAEVVAGLEREGLTVLRAPICRVRDEFARAVGDFEAQGAEALVTLHLAYSPSLEALEPLERTDLPLVICDTTMDFAFGPQTDAQRLMFNHGIHGVQDLACMLRRRGKEFAIAAGHVSRSNVLARTAALVRAGYAARQLRRMHALRIGEPFAGMGDFAVSEAVLREALGLRVDQISSAALSAEAAHVTEEQIEAEMAEDRARYEVEAPPDVHRRSVRAGLALRRKLDAGGYGCFSMNFLAFDSVTAAVDTVPFLEACKAMARGLGYAGEGDVLTAALVGALNGAFGGTTFTEIFCPDWEGGALFLSHMGEINPEVAAGKPLLCEKPFAFTGARNPAILACAPRPGPALLVNLAPGARDSFTLLAAPVEVLNDSTHPTMQRIVRGWIKPRGDLAAFLEDYSRHGGTHHCALALNVSAEAVEALARFAGAGFALL